MERKEGEGLSWRLGPGRRFQVETQKADKPDWYPVEVPADHQVLIGQGRISQGGRIGLGIISQITPDSFFSGNTLVSLKKKARIFFQKKK